MFRKQSVLLYFSLTNIFQRCSELVFSTDWLSACDLWLNTTAKMPAVSTGVKELYLSTSLGELNKKAEIKPEKTSTRR